MLWAVVARASPLDSAHGGIDRQFADAVRPFLETYCLACHSGDAPEAELDLSIYSNTASVVRDFANWSRVLEKLSAKEMPPEDADEHPTAEARQRVIDWIEAMRRNEALRHAGDPGIVLARRLSHAEYDYTIHDLTGVDIRPTREFPVDPTNPAGFDNSGESLAMSPTLMAKYLQAAREVADHLVLKPSWTKGGRARVVPIRTDAQRDVLCRAHQLVGRGSLIPSTRNYRHQLRVYERHTADVGFSKLHGLRHRYAQVRYEELTGWKAPAAGYPRSRVLSREQRVLDENARLAVSRELGHEREAITAVYLGR